MTRTLRLAAALLVATGTFVASAEPPGPKDSSPVVYDTTSIGALAVDAASKAASDSGRRLLVNFGTNDCAPCRTFADAIYEQPFVEAFYKQFIVVFVDVSAGSKNRELLDRYGIDASKGFPAVVISNEELKVAEVTKHGEMAKVAAKGQGAVRDWLLARFVKDSKK